MDNLYKKILYKGVYYTIIHEFKNNIALMSDDGIIRLNFNTNYDLEQFISNNQITK